jgi:lysophospholipase L1-like esterase
MAERGIPFVELDSLFMSRIPVNEQNSYFENETHPNKKGADLLSVMLAEALAEWLIPD